MTRISMQAALAMGYAEVAAPKRDPRGTPDVDLGELQALIAFCRVQTALHANGAGYAARPLLEGGEDEDGAECLLIAAYQRIGDATALEEAAMEAAE